jgi:hypothetical protein
MASNKIWISDVNKFTNMYLNGPCVGRFNPKEKTFGEAFYEWFFLDLIPESFNELVCKIKNSNDSKEVINLANPIIDFNK